MRIGGDFVRVELSNISHECSYNNKLVKVPRGEPQRRFISARDRRLTNADGSRASFARIPREEMQFRIT